MSKKINLEWMNELLNERSDRSDPANNLPRIDWIQNNKGFKKLFQFKVVAANSKENNIFSWVVGTHWLNQAIEGSTVRFVCPEQTQHLRKLGVKCPVCEAKRRLLSMGFKEEELTTQGKFGPLPMFDPQITSSVKVVAIDSDTKSDWDKAHISILQQKGNFLTKWLAERYVDKDTPDLLEWERSNTIKFSRQSENGRWDREISFATFNPSLEVIEKLKEENEALTMPDLWKMPDDQQFMHVQQLMEQKITELKEAKNAINSITAPTQVSMEDMIPF